MSMDIAEIYNTVRECLDANNNEKALKQIRLGLDTIGENHEELYYHVLKCRLIECLHAQTEYETVVATAREYLDELKFTHHGIMRVLSLEAASSAALGLYIEAAKASLQAFEAFILFKNGLMDVDMEVVLPVDNDTRTGSPFYLCRILENYSQAGDYTTAAEIITSYASTSTPSEIILICEAIINCEGATSALIAQVAALALTRMAESGDYTAAADIHEIAVRLAHKHGTTPNTVVGEYIQSAGEAYQARDHGDILGYIRGLRQAFRFNPAMKDVVLLCIEQI
ncbi:MAG: hypothetical protein FWB80_12510 [Defluviitaleaceae bacterium]|nr:hypothetical protein [Defluviitaleaceae bacterium]